MSTKNLTLTLEHIIEAERDCQSLSPKSVLASPKTQIGLPEPILLRTMAEASGMGLSPEVLIIALLQAFNGADESIKTGLAVELSRLRNPGGASAPGCDFQAQ
jgi:hypothetical protein